MWGLDPVAQVLDEGAPHLARNALINLLHPRPWPPGSRSSAAARTPAGPWYFAVDPDGGTAPAGPDLFAGVTLPDLDPDNVGWPGGPRCSPPPPPPRPRRCWPWPATPTRPVRAQALAELADLARRPDPGRRRRTARRPPRSPGPLPPGVGPRRCRGQPRHRARPPWPPSPTTPTRMSWPPSPHHRPARGPAPPAGPHPRPQRAGRAVAATPPPPSSRPRHPGPRPRRYTAPTRPGRPHTGRYRPQSPAPTGRPPGLVTVVARRSTPPHPARPPPIPTAAAADPTHPRLPRRAVGVLVAAAAVVALTVGGWAVVSTLGTDPAPTASA